MNVVSTASTCASSTATGRVFDHLALGIAGGRALPQTYRRAITFVGIQQGDGEFGGFAETDRQQAGGQRIERAGMSGFLGVDTDGGLFAGRCWS